MFYTVNNLCTKGLMNKEMQKNPFSQPWFDREFQTSFDPHRHRKAAQKPSTSAASDAQDHPSGLRSIHPWRSAHYWFDREDFDDTLVALGTHLFVSAFLVGAGHIVNGIQALYSEKVIPLTRSHGNLGDSPTKIELEWGDRWSQISGFSGMWFGGDYVLQLTFRTHKGKVYGPFGNMHYVYNIQPFRLVIQPDEKIVALSGVVSTGDNGKNLHLGALGLILCKDDSK